MAKMSPVQKNIADRVEFVHYIEIDRLTKMVEVLRVACEGFNPETAGAMAKDVLMQSSRVQDLINHHWGERN